MYAVAAYLIWWLAAAAGLPFPIAAGLGTLATALLGVAAYLVLYRPFLRRESPTFVVLVASLGLFIVTANLLGIVFGTAAKTVPSVTYDIYFVGDVAISAVQISQVISLILISALLALFLRLTAYGNAIRAMTDNAPMARVVGIDTERVAILVFAIGSAISAVPAAHVLIKDGALPGMGFLAVFFAFVTVVVGGVGSIWGAALGGMLLGLVESLGMWRIPSEWQHSIAFLVLFVVLLWRPTGLLKGN
jgi:branched-chain amino acid transport system permease protein